MDRRDQLYSVVQERDRPRLPLLQSFDWNLDVTLTTAYVSFFLDSFILYTYYLLLDLYHVVLNHYYIFNFVQLIIEI